ncbi:hypothetical protein JB92DRAFT_2690761 [Gautieria morchelliformis]|nr:hypothetical protein JB92DRAFT_2690761 [Gautieria morchelliformis]
MRFLRPLIFGLTASASISAKSLQQYHQRSLVDVCANVDADLLTLGKLDLCICVSAIPNLLSTNPLLKIAVNLYGTGVVTNALKALINSAADHTECKYPPHAVPVCDSNPCDFTCNDGFTPYPPTYPTSCVCEPPYTVCNGVCGNFPSCSSQRAKRDAGRDATCAKGLSVCRIRGRSSFEVECVDVSKNLWSCGGCDIPLHPTDPTGVDCTAIHGVHDVSCLNSRCVVDRCKANFQVNADKTACTPVTSTSPNAHVLVHNGAGRFKARDA